jgi:hypothetical protein
VLNSAECEDATHLNTRNQAPLQSINSPNDCWCFNVTVAQGSTLGSSDNNHPALLFKHSRNQTLPYVMY